MNSKNMPMYVLALLCVMATKSIQADSRSFFTPRSITTDSTFELADANYHRYHSDPKSNIQIYAKPFVTGSWNKGALARYFLPKNKECVTLDESGNGDIDPLWFDLSSPKGTFYTSNVTLSPVRIAGGAIFTFYGAYKYLWWGLNTTVMNSRTNLKVCETNRTQTGTLPGIADACDAFNNPTWTAGKLPCHSVNRTGLDDIQLKFGYDPIKNKDNHFSIYAVGTIPTGKRPNSCTLFEPLVGSKHGSLGFGFDGDAIVYRDSKQTLNVLGDFKYRYVFRATERRSLDLTNNGDWSRYLLVTTDGSLIALPGINLLTTAVKVTPRSTVDLWTALHYQRSCFDLEVGYDFWWRQAEKVCPKCSITETYGIQTLALGGPITSASTANISQSAVGSNATVTDVVFTPITNADLNFNSAANPAAFSNKVYASFTYTQDQFKHHDPARYRSWLVGLGTSYEIANKNALSQWSIWLTGGFAF